MRTTKRSWDIIWQRKIPRIDVHEKLNSISHSEYQTDGIQKTKDATSYINRSHHTQRDMKFNPSLLTNTHPLAPAKNTTVTDRLNFASLPKWIFRKFQPWRRCRSETVTSQAPWSLPPLFDITCVGSAVQASLRIRKISLTGPFHSPISFASTTKIQPNTLSIAYDA